MQLYQRMAAPKYTCELAGVLLITETPGGAQHPTGVYYYWRSIFLQEKS
jgi:hypothetical protein